MKEKTLSKKEKLFCSYFSVLRNARESAALSGYILPFTTGNMLLQKSSVKKEIDLLTSKYPDCDEVKAGFRRLAFGSTADCIKLVFKDDIKDEDIESFDLFNISEIKKAKNGNVEIKFFDRIKAMEHLLNCENTHNNDSAVEFFEAIQKGANAIKSVGLNE